jgi:hypothetical protein
VRGQLEGVGELIGKRDIWSRGRKVILGRRKLYD